MTGVADRFVVVLDANVLYPFRVRDVLLRYAEAGLFRARWSPQIIDEWDRSLLRDKPHLEDSVLSQKKAMAKAFPEALVEGSEGLVETLQLPDPNDRHVLAAAILAGAQHIVTENLKDFPSEILEPFGVEAVSADQFLASTFELYPSEAMRALRQMRSDYRNPSFGQSDFIMEITRVGLVQLAALLRKEIDLL